LQNKVTLFCRI